MLAFRRGRSRRSVVIFAIAGLVLASCGSPASNSSTHHPTGKHTSVVESVSSTKAAVVSVAPASISFPTLDDGYIAESDYLAHTVDGGRSWAVIRPGLGAVVQVQFLTSTDGFVLTREGLFSTTDAGLTWKSPGNALTALAWISFSTLRNGWGLANGVLWRTANGGATWKRLVTPTPATTACFVSAGTGWIEGTPHSKRSPLISETIDGGVTWLNRRLPPTLERETGQPPYSVTALSCASPTTIGALLVPAGAGYSGGETYGVYDSSNGGRSWRLAGVNPAKQKISVAPSAQPEALEVTKDSTAAYVAASCGACDNLGTTTVGVMRNGHTAWHIALLKGVGFSSVDLMAFPTDSSAWVLTSAYLTSRTSRLVLFETQNFGFTWTLRPIFAAR
ncbi:MAG: WD40/YVTN/BNR-like repeat-containing protein [Acidimicrobiales bacterium]